MHVQEKNRFTDLAREENIQRAIEWARTRIIMDPTDSNLDLNTKELNTDRHPHMIPGALTPAMISVMLIYVDSIPLCVDTRGS